MSLEREVGRFDRLQSVRVRVVLVASAAVALVLIAIGLVLLQLQESAAIEHLDDILTEEAQAISRAIVEGRDIPELFHETRIMLATGPSGETLASEGVADDLAGLDLQPRDHRGVTMSFHGQAHRIVAERFPAPTGMGVAIVAEPLDQLHDSVAELGETLRLAIPITVAVLAVIIWWLVGLALRPVEQLRAEVAGLGMRQLAHRVRVPPGDDEVTRLAITLNEMLERLERAVRRQQRFVADASHELRTPLARMRSEVEADVLDPVAANLACSRQSQLEELDVLQGMVDDLLILARVDADPKELCRETVDLDDLVLDEIRSLRATSSKSIDASGVSAAQVHGSSAGLRRVFRNLLDNGNRHASTTMAVTLSEADGRATFTVDDDGPGVPDERREEVFERFRRLSGSREEHGSGAGLGLAIVAETVARHNGTVTVDDSPLGGARFVVTLPLRAASTSRPLVTSMS
jgi:signal transduction histidine kinase